MRKLLIPLALLVAPLQTFASTAGDPPKEASSAEVSALVGKIQSFYEKTDGIDTRFEQQFRQQGIPSRLGGITAKGRLRFRKPKGDVGPRMRWDYDDGRILLLAGNTSHTFDPDTKQVTTYKLDPSTLSAAVTFLWGKGNLAEEFEISKAERKDLGDEGVALRLVPKKRGGFARVYLVADPKTGLVYRSIVVQEGGGENRITFVDPKIGQVAPLSEFEPDTAFPKDAVRVESKLP